MILLGLLRCKVRPGSGGKMSTSWTRLGYLVGWLSISLINFGKRYLPHSRKDFGAG